jgi:predicted kinase
MCSKQLIIVRGLPGSGKSSIATNLGVPANNIFSVDDYWLRPDGTYDFNYDYVAKSYQWNHQRVSATMASKVLDTKTTLVVDNVNITFDEILPYVEAAQVYKYSIKLLEPQTEWRYDVEECYKNNTHSVPYSTVRRMYSEWQTTASLEARLIELGYWIIQADER